MCALWGDCRLGFTFKLPVPRVALLTSGSAIGLRYCRCSSPLFHPNLNLKFASGPFLPPLMATGNSES